MRVIPLTSLLSHKGRGCRSPKLDDTLSLEVRKLFKHPIRGLQMKRGGFQTRPSLWFNRVMPLVLEPISKRPMSFRRSPSAPLRINSAKHLPHKAQ